MEQNKTIKLELSVEKLNIVLTALASQPFSQVAQLISEIQNEAQKQLQNEEVKK